MMWPRTASDTFIAVARLAAPPARRQVVGGTRTLATEGTLETNGLHFAASRAGGAHRPQVLRFVDADLVASQITQDLLALAASKPWLHWAVGRAARARPR